MKQSDLKQIHQLSHHLEFTPEDLRWATPQIVADYRAKRLKCNIIADIGCGVGFQAFSLAKTCKKVYAIDIDKDKLKRSKNNAKILGLKNIIFIHGDALDPQVVKTVSDTQVVFCDPQRPPQEKERNIQQISPNINKLLSTYSAITSKIAIEFPPQIKESQIKEIPYDCEQEYLSMDGALNRLTLYFNELKQASRSAVVLPAGQRLFSETESLVIKTSAILLSYLYEVDLAVVKAKLLAELSLKTKTLLYSQGKFVFFTSEKLISSPFFKNSFKVDRELTFNLTEIIKVLQQEKVGSVLLRYTIDPQQYWSERKKLEAKLTGTKVIHLFRFKDRAVIAEKI